MTINWTRNTFRTKSLLKPQPRPGFGGSSAGRAKLLTAILRHCSHAATQTQRTGFRQPSDLDLVYDRRRVVCPRSVDLVEVDRRRGWGLLGYCSELRGLTVVQLKAGGFSRPEDTRVRTDEQGVLH